MEVADIDRSWRKSTYSGGASSSCVEVGSGAYVLVRDTKQAGRADRTVLEVSDVAWSKFTAGLK